MVSLKDTILAIAYMPLSFNFFITGSISFIIGLLLADFVYLFISSETVPSSFWIRTSRRSAENFNSPN